MRLIEFDLDLEYVINEDNVALLENENGCGKNEATRNDYELNWKWKRREFSLQTRCITALFSRLLGYINTSDCKKIVVKCVPEIHGKKTVTYPDGFCDVQIKFDYNAYTTLDDFDKKKASLEALMDGIRTVAEEKKWIIEPFESVYDRIKEIRYKNEWVWKKPIKSPDNNAIASVLLQHEISEITISIIISNKSGDELFRKKIMSELPDEWNYARHLGEIKWVSEYEVVLINKKKDEEWLVNTKDLLL